MIIGGYSKNISNGKRIGFRNGLNVYLKIFKKIIRKRTWPKQHFLKIEKINYLYSLIGKSVVDVL
jgi:hypothetical protein